MKTFTVQATSFTSLQAHVRVPDDWTEDDVRRHFRQNGAMGEFRETGSDWEWGDITEDPDIPDSEIDDTFAEDTPKPETS